MRYEMNVVFTIPITPPRFLVYIFRTCLALILVGSVIFTTIGFIKAERQIERTPAHGHHASPTH
jgi:hypothetical protein